MIPTDDMVRSAEVIRADGILLWGTELLRQIVETGDSKDVPVLHIDCESPQELSAIVAQVRRVKGSCDADEVTDGQHRLN